MSFWSDPETQRIMDAYDKRQLALRAIVAEAFEAAAEKAPLGERQRAIILSILTSVADLVGSAEQLDIKALSVTREDWGKKHGLVRVNVEAGRKSDEGTMAYLLRERRQFWVTSKGAVWANHPKTSRLIQKRQEALDIARYGRLMTNKKDPPGRPGRP